MDIEKATFVKADEETTKSLTFDLLTGLHVKVDNLTQCYEKHIGVCEGRFVKLEKRKKVDTVVAGGSGILGGFIAHLFQWFK